MKFLIALTVLISSSAFANGLDLGGKIKCYESPQQTGRGDVKYVFQTENGRIKLAYPERIWLEQEREGNHYCLEEQRSRDGETGDTGSFFNRFKACPGQGQEIGGLIPVEVDNSQNETVYCEREIEKWFWQTPTML